MAGPKKKPRPEDIEDSAESSGDENSSEDDNQMFEDIQATFEGRNPEGQDFHGIKQLLQQLFSTAHIDTSQLSDMLIAQTGIGSVLKQSYSDSDDEDAMEIGDENDVYGITSIINLTSHKETPCVQQFYQLINDLCSSNADKQTQLVIKKILSETQKLGLLINERFINIPAKVAAPMLGALQEELSRMKKKDQSYDFEYFIMICKTWKQKDISSKDEMNFANDEEQIFVQQCDVNFEYSLQGKTDTGLTGKWHSNDKELIPSRIVVLFKADKFDGIVNAIKNYLC